MKKSFFSAVRAGTKTTTLRYWRSLRVGEDTVQKVPGLGWVRIDAIRQVDPASLTDADARADGFADLAALQEALVEIYPPAKRAGRRLFQIHFTYLPDGPDAPGHGAGGPPG